MLTLLATATIGRERKKRKCLSVLVRHKKKTIFGILFVCRRFQHLHRFSCQRAGALKFVNYLLNVFSGWDTIFQRALSLSLASLHSVHIFFRRWPLYSYHWHRNIFCEREICRRCLHFSGWEKKILWVHGKVVGQPGHSPRGKREEKWLQNNNGAAKKWGVCTRASVRSPSNVSTPK